MLLNKARPRVLLLSLLTALLALGAGAQEPNPATQRESLRIGPGDLLAIHIFREDDLDVKVRVKDAGTVTLPLVGSLQVGGMAAADASSAIADKYQGDGFLKHPQVSVLIEESAAQQVAVLGEVGRPGTVAVASPRSLLDVLAEAGGLLKTADRHVTIRRSSGASVTALVPNDAAGELKPAGLLVQPGDTVLVPRAGIVYVLGDVGRPGGYLMQDDAQLSLLQALALAAGTTRTAGEGDARLIRRSNGATTEIPLHLKDREHGRMPDMALENNDIIYVPFSFGKNMALGANAVAASASSAIIYAAF